MRVVDKTTNITRTLERKYWDSLTVSLLVEYLWEYECEDESDVLCLEK